MQDRATSAPGAPPEAATGSDATGSDAASGSYRGAVDGPSLADVLRRLHENRRNVTVEVECTSEEIHPHTRQVRIHLRNGEVVHAEAGELRGKEALLLALASENGWVRTRAPQPCRKTIRAPFPALLLELLEEAAVQAPGTPSSSSGDSAADDGRATGGQEARTSRPSEIRTGPLPLANSSRSEHSRTVAAPPQPHPDHEFLDDLSHDTPFPPGLDYVSSDVPIEPISSASVSHPTVDAPGSSTVDAPGSYGLAPTASQSWDSMSLYSRDVLPPPPPPETSRILAVMLGIALALTLIATVMAVVWVFRGSMSRSGPLVVPNTASFEIDQALAESASTGTPNATSNLARTAKPEPIVAIDTRPDGLEIVDADTRRSLGYTPLTITVPRGTGLNVRAKLGQRYSRRLEISSREEAVTFDLRRWVDPPRYQAPKSSAVRGDDAPDRSEKGVPPAPNNAKRANRVTGWGREAEPSIGLIEDLEPALHILDD